jgi:hypothetical protein
VSTHFGPMAGGLDIDMETGDPTELGAIARQAQAVERRNRRIERHAALVEDLAGHGGVVVRQLAQKLVARIEHLIKADPEASAYLSVLQELQHDLQVGERIVQDEMETLLRKEFADG